MALSNAATHTHVKAPMFRCATLLIASTLTQACLAGTAQSFDPARGVALSGPEAQVVVESCGGTTAHGNWPLSPNDLQSLESKLAPLLADDLRKIGSTFLPRQYYHQYASGRVGNFHAIFVNAFYESHVSRAMDNFNWRDRAVVVLDGGAGYWCAVYIKETGKFVKYKGASHGGTYVLFHGVA